LSFLVEMLVMMMLRWMLACCLLLANERASCTEWRCSIMPESQGESFGQCFICNCLCIGLTDSVLSSGPIVLTVPQQLIPGRTRRKSSSATVSNL